MVTISKAHEGKRKKLGKWSILQSILITAQAELFSNPKDWRKSPGQVGDQSEMEQPLEYGS